MNIESSKATSYHLWPGLQVLVMVAVLFSPGPVHAEFALQFNRVIPYTEVNCSPSLSCTVDGGGSNINGGTTSGNDGSRFIQEKLYIDGANYFHVVVGSPDSGFAIESYVLTDNKVSAAVQNAGANTRPFTPYSGGNERAVMGNKDVVNLASGFQGRHSFGNSYDPLGLTVDPATGFKSYDLSGNGTMDPSRVSLRMVVSDAEVSVEVLKPILERKPLISQTTNDDEISGLFVADMRGLSYSESTQAA